MSAVHGVIYVCMYVCMYVCTVVRSPSISLCWHIEVNSIAVYCVFLQMRESMSRA